MWTFIVLSSPKNSSSHTVSNKFALVKTFFGLQTKSSNILNSLEVSCISSPLTLTSLLLGSNIRFLYFIVSTPSLEFVILLLLKSASTLAKTSLTSKGLLIKSSAPNFKTFIFHCSFCWYNYYWSVLYLSNLLYKYFTSYTW